MQLDVRRLEQKTRKSRSTREVRRGREHVAERFSTAHAVAHQEERLALYFRQRRHVQDKVVDVGDDERSRSSVPIVGRLLAGAAPAPLVKAVHGDVEWRSTQGGKQVIICYQGSVHE